MKRLSGSDIHNALGFQLGGYPPATIAIIVSQIEDFLHANRFVRVHFDFVQLSVLFPETPSFDKLVTVGGTATSEAPFLNDLTQPGLGSDGGFETLARRLPVT